MVEVETAPAAEEHVSAKPGDGQAGKYTQPGIQLLGHDVARGIKGDGAKSKNSRGMRGGDDEAEQQGMPRRASRANQVGGDDRLAVAGFKRVQRSQPEGDEGGRDEEPETQAAGGDQFGERAARGCLLVGLEMQGLQAVDSVEWQPLGRSRRWCRARYAYGRTASDSGFASEAAAMQRAACASSSAIG